MPDPIPIPKHSPWVTQFLVIRALLIREVTTRFGKYRLGFFWMLFEPIAGTVILGLVIAPFAHRSVPEIPYTFFILNGFLLYKLFTAPMSAGVNAINANQGLLVYPSVRPIDPLLARFFYELITIMFSFSLFCVVGMWMGISLSLDSLHIILAAYLITWLCGCGLGFLLGVAAAHFNEVEKFLPMIRRILLFTSAVLFTTNILPRSTRELFLYNPLVHTIEMSRHALFPTYKADGTNLTYPCIVAIVLLAVGISFFHNNRNSLRNLGRQ